MAYQTGTANSASELKTTIENFATTYGWSLASGWLAKGLGAVSLSYDTPQTGYLGITGACDGSGTDPAGYTKYLYVPSAKWPVTYYLFSQSTPDIIACVILYDSSFVQHLIFGDIVKVNSSAFTGGNFFHAPFAATAHTTTNGYYYSQRQFVGAPYIIPTITDGIHSTSLFTVGYQWDSLASTNQSSPIPLYKPYNSTQNQSGLHAEIDSEMWDTTGKTTYIDSTLANIYRSPSQWTSQAILTPINLAYAMDDNLWGYLGYMEHVRLLRIDNYNIADEITISPDVWKVFPLLKKDASQADGLTPYSAYTYGHTGTLGLAYRK